MEFRISDFRFQIWDLGFQAFFIPNRCFVPQHDKGNTLLSDEPLVMLNGVKHLDCRFQISDLVRGR